MVFKEADSIPDDGPATSAVRALADDNNLRYEVTVLNPRTGTFEDRRSCQSVKRAARLSFRSGRLPGRARRRPERVLLRVRRKGRGVVGRLSAAECATRVKGRLIPNAVLYRDWPLRPDLCPDPP